MCEGVCRHEYPCSQVCSCPFLLNSLESMVYPRLQKFMDGVRIMDTFFRKVNTVSMLQTYHEQRSLTPTCLYTSQATLSSLLLPLILHSSSLSFPSIRTYRIMQVRVTHLSIDVHHVRIYKFPYSLTPLLLCLLQWIKTVLIIVIVVWRDMKEKNPPCQHIYICFIHSWWWSCKCCDLGSVSREGGNSANSSRSSIIPTMEGKKKSK